MGQHFGGRDFAPPLNHEQRLDRLALDWIWDADYRGLSDAGDFVENRFDFLGRDFFAAALDDVVLAADEIEIPIFISPENIAGVANAFVGKGAWTVPRS